MPDISRNERLITPIQVLFLIVFAGAFGAWYYEIDVPALGEGMLNLLRGFLSLFGIRAFD